MRFIRNVGRTKRGSRCKSQVHCKKKTDGVKPRDEKMGEKWAVWIVNNNLLTNSCGKMMLKHSGSSTFLQRGSPPPPPWRLLPEFL